jgi:hypothetical protein
VCDQSLILIQLMQERIEKFMERLDAGEPPDPEWPHVIANSLQQLPVCNYKTINHCCCATHWCFPMLQMQRDARQTGQCPSASWLTKATYTRQHACCLGSLGNQKALFNEDHAASSEEVFPGKWNCAYCLLQEGDS